MAYNWHLIFERKIAIFLFDFIDFRMKYRFSFYGDISVQVSYSDN